MSWNDDPSTPAPWATKTAPAPVATTERAPEGRKNDDGKNRWDLLPFRALNEVVAVQTFGAKKYGDNNWQQLLSPNGRYFAACMRHLWAWRMGEMRDAESGLPHLAHAACCILFMLSLWVGVDPILDTNS